MRFTVAEVADFARAVTEGDPVDLGNLEVDPAALYELMAGQVLESLERATAGSDGPARDRLEAATLLGLLVRATVENFALHQRLLLTQSRLRAGEARLARLGQPLD